MITLIKLLGTISIVLAIILYTVLVGAFVTFKTWTWFIIPLMEWPMITISQAIGLNIALSLFKYHHINDIKSGYKEPNALQSILIRPWLMLLILWLIHLMITIEPIFKM